MGRNVSLGVCLRGYTLSVAPSSSPFPSHLPYPLSPCHRLSSSPALFPIPSWQLYRAVCCDVLP